MPVTFTTNGALKKSALREANERLVLNTIRQNPSLSRADIVRITGLSPSSVTFIVKRLKAGDIICECKTENWSQVGRLPTAIQLRANARVGIGVELGLAGGRIVVARGGLGTGVIINGEILQGSTFGASEFGHIPLFADGRKCSCGNSGCWEQYASDFALTRLYSERAQLAAAHELEPEAIIAKVRA